MFLRLRGRANSAPQLIETMMFLLFSLCRSKNSIVQHGCCDEFVTLSPHFRGRISMQLLVCYRQG